VAYTADINIVVKGQAAVNTLQKSLIEVGEKIDAIAKRRIGPSTTLDTFNKQLAEAQSRLSQVAAATPQETAAIKNYVTALGNANAATERQNKLIQNEIDLREAATKNIQEFAAVQDSLYEKQRKLENSKLDEKAARIQAELDKQAAAAAESAAQIEKLNARQAEFITRTDAAAQAAARQTAEFIRQQRIAKEVAKINANAPAPQLLLPAAAPGSPAISGGARRAITGPVERLGGARTEDQAATALRFAQALKEQVRPLSQIQALYAGIAREAAQLQKIKALPDSAMLNAAGRGIKSLETAQDRYNRELQESAERLQQVDRLEQSRQRRAEKLRNIADYYGTPSAMANAGFGVQGPAVPPGGVPGRPRAGAGGGGGRTAGQLFENLALGAGFPLLFGGGPGQVLGGLAGSFVGTGFGGQILGSALGGQLEQLGIAAAQAGQALQKPIDNFGVIEQRAILASSSQERYIKQLIDGGQFIEATAAIQKRYNDVVGAQGSANLLELAQSSDELNRAWSELNLQLQAALAGPLADLVNWVAGLVQAGADANREARTQSEIFAALSPEQQKQFKAQEAEILKGANIFNEAEKRRQVAELARRFGGAGQQQQAPAQSFKASEVQDTASIERRREIQAQITQLRQAELTAAQGQLQQDITILTKQQEFATSLNQQSAIIDAIAAKKIESANLEYQQVQRTQQTEIINKQLALESAKAKALAAQEEIKQLDAAKKLTPERQAELSAIIERVTVAERDLATTKAIANVVTQRAAKERESAAALGELERKQQNVAAFAADAARQTEAFSRASAEANNALDNRLRVSDALTQAAIAVNSVELQSLQTKLTQAQTEGQRLDIINSIKDLEIENAQLTLIASRQQIAAEVERQRTALANAEVKFRELQAVVELARAQGVLNQAYIDALNAQRSALAIAQNNFQTSVQVANAQNAAAEATFRAAVNAANFKAQLEGSARAAGAVAGSLERAAAATGAGRPSALSFFGEAGRNPLFAAEFQRRVDELNQQASTFTTASKAYNDLVIEFTEKARQFNEQVAAERLAGATEDFIERTGDTNLGLTLFRNAINAGADSAIRLDIAQAEAARALEERYRLRNSMDASAGNSSGGFVSNQQNTGAGSPLNSQNAQQNTGARSSFTPQVNITTGPVMQMGNDTFVTQRDLVRASQQAAEQGANLALQNLQNSPSLRRNAGLTR
jgi:hypothetical protein